MKPLYNAISTGFVDIAQYLVTSFLKMIKKIIDEKSVLETLEYSSRLADKTTLEEFLVRRIYRIEGKLLYVKRLLYSLLSKRTTCLITLYFTNKAITGSSIFIIRSRIPLSSTNNFIRQGIILELILF